mmetsp:Transcript_33503/g.98476  ORF Transcript_33503/g.98476 Transcript_33503/m.98476 type:complete len:212 (+) Transcript_33503:389-1024(+)
MWACTSGSIERLSSRCCLLATSLSSATAERSAPSAPLHCAACRPDVAASGTAAAASAASSLSWNAASAAETSPCRAVRVDWRPEMKAFSQWVETALKIGATSASFMLMRNTPWRRVVALYVAQWRPPCVTEMPHCCVVASASAFDCSAPILSCGATCESKASCTLASAPRAASASVVRSEAACVSKTPLAASRVACGSWCSCSSSASSPTT